MAPVTEQEGRGLGDKARRSEDDAEEAEDDADEEGEEVEADANAHSHLPLAPHSDSEVISQERDEVISPLFVLRFKSRLSLFG